MAAVLQVRHADQVVPDSRSVRQIIGQFPGPDGCIDRNHVLIHGRRLCRLLMPPSVCYYPIVYQECVQKSTISASEKPILTLPVG